MWAIMLGSSMELQEDQLARGDAAASDGTSVEARIRCEVCAGTSKLAMLF